MIRQLILAVCLVTLAYSACYTIGPAIGGFCPSGYSVVTVNGEQLCADDANVAECTSNGKGKEGAAACQDVNPNCANWLKTGFCTSQFYTATQKKTSCAKSCGLC